MELPAECALIKQPNSESSRAVVCLNLLTDPFLCPLSPSFRLLSRNSCFRLCDETLDDAQRNFDRAKVDYKLSSGVPKGNPADWDRITVRHINQVQAHAARLRVLEPTCTIANFAKIEVHKKPLKINVEKKKGNCQFSNDQSTIDNRPLFRPFFAFKKFMSTRDGIEFGIANVELSDIGAIVDGRCHRGPIVLGQIFTLLSTMTVHITPEVCGPSTLNGVASVNLRIESILWYGHQLDELFPSMAARLELRGTGAEQIVPGLVLT